MENEKLTPAEWMLENIPSTQILNASKIEKNDLIYKMRKYVFGGDNRLEPVACRVVRVTRNTLQIQQSDGYTKFVTKLVNGKQRKFVVRKEINFSNIGSLELLDESGSTSTTTNSPLSKGARLTE